MSKIKIAIIGAGGYWAKNIINCLLKIKEIDYNIYICENDDSKLKNLYNNFGRYGMSNKNDHFRFKTSTFEEILKNEEIQLVFVATPIDTHSKIVSDCLCFGKHVFVEKPLAQRFEDALYLYTMAKQKKLLLQVDHTFLFSPEISYFKDKINKNLIYGFKSFLSRRVNWGPFLKNCSIIEDLSPHDLSIMGNLFGFDELSDVSCYLQKNEAFINFTYNNGFYYSNHVSWQQPQKERYLSFVGENVSYVYNFDSSITIKKENGFLTEKLIQNETPLELSITNFVNNFISGKISPDFDIVYNVYLLESIAEAGRVKTSVNLKNSYKQLKDKYV
jgi:predicted dehydrogenase